MTQLLDRRESQAEVVSREEYERLIDRIKRLEGRMRLQEAVRLLPYAVLAGGGVGLIAAVWSRITPSLTWEQVLIIAAAAMMIAVAGTLGYALIRPRNLIQTARRADLALGLKERLSTAVEGHNDPQGLGYKLLGARQFNDAKNSLEGMRANKALPLRLPKKPALASLVLIPLLAVALIIPNPFSDVVKDRQEVQKQVQQEAQKIEDLKKQIEQQNPAAKNDPKTQELLKQLEKVKQELLEKSENKDEAVASLQQAEQELQKLTDPQQPAEKAALEQLARDLQSSDLTKQAGQALSQNSSDRFDKAADELNKAAQNVDQLKKDSTQAQQLSDKLAKDAQNFKNSDPNLSQKLQQASDSLKPDNLNKNTDAAKQSLQNLGQQLQKTGQDQQAQDQLQQAQSQLQKSEQAISQAGQKSSSQQQSGNQQNNRGETSGDEESGGMPSDPNMQQGDPQQGDAQQGQAQQGDQGQQQGQQGQQGDQGQQQGQDGQQGDQGQQQGQGQGQDQGQGQQQGQGQDGQQGDQGQQQGQNGQNGQNGSKAGNGKNDNFYANPTMRNQNGQQVNVNGKKGDGPQQSQTVNGGQAGGDAKVPLSDVIEAYKNAASESLDKNYIPITLKDVVKKYFDDLNNGAGNGK